MTEIRTRSFRGISARLAREYLRTLGGTPVDDGSIAGEGWEATLSEQTVAIGPTLSLTEVTVRFEGEKDRLEDVIDAFAQKAMRAGG